MKTKESSFFSRNTMPYILRVAYKKVKTENDVVRKYVTITQEFYVGDGRELPHSKTIEIEKSDVQLIIDSLERIKNEI